MIKNLAQVFIVSIFCVAVIVAILFVTQPNVFNVNSLFQNSAQTTPLASTTQSTMPAVATTSLPKVSSITQQTTQKSIVNNKNAIEPSGNVVKTVSSTTTTFNPTLPTANTTPIISATDSTTNNTDTVITGTVAITQGGTYTGTNVTKITVQTSEPVTLENITGSNSSGDFIDAHGPVHLTIRHVSAYAKGWFVDADGYAAVTIENNTTQSGTDGILLENGVSGATAIVCYNAFNNIIGPYEHGNAFMIANTQAGKTEVAWNQVINYPSQSQTEDNINVYNSSGTSGNPILIHDNYIQGAYPPDPQSADFSGGGIITDHKAAFVTINHNTVVDTINYGVAIATGHDNTLTNNTVIMDEKLPATNVGIYIWNEYHDSAWSNNGAIGNSVYMSNGNSWWHPDSTYWSNNISIGQTTAAAAHSAWQATLGSQEIGA